MFSPPEILFRKNLQTPRTGDSPAVLANPIHHEQRERRYSPTPFFLVFLAGALLGASFILWGLKGLK